MAAAGALRCFPQAPTANPLPGPAGLSGVGARAPPWAGFLPKSELSPESGVVVTPSAPAEVTSGPRRSHTPE